MDFKQLRSFVTVADCGSFTQAAVRLYTSQPTVSAHIRQLEDELHETLFLRTTKSLAITARGQELYDYAVHVLELQDQLLDAWAQDEHTIRLGASTIPSAYILPEVLPPFRAQHPDAVFSVLQSDSAGVLQQLRAGRFELGFAGAQEQSPELVFLPFFRDRMVLITPNTPHFAKLLQDGTPVRNILEREPLLLREAGSGSQKCADAFLEEEGLSQRTLHVAARLEDQQSIKNLVAAGLGVSIISGKAAQDDCASGRLLAFPLPANRAGRSLYLVWRKNGVLRQQTLGFIEFVRNFYDRIFSGQDPLTLLRKEEEKAAERRKNQNKQQTTPVQTPDEVSIYAPQPLYISQQYTKSRGRIGLFIGAGATVLIFIILIIILFFRH